MSADCRFHLLNRANPGRSSSIYIGPGGGLVTDHPPLVGDEILLVGQIVDPADEDQLVKVAESFTVLARRWLPAGYGSHNWPRGTTTAYGHMWLDIMVEPIAHEFYALERWARPL